MLFKVFLRSPIPLSVLTLPPLAFPELPHNIFLASASPLQFAEHTELHKKLTIPAAHPSMLLYASLILDELPLIAGSVEFVLLHIDWIFGHKSNTQSLSCFV